MSIFITIIKEDIYRERCACISIYLFIISDEFRDNESYYIIIIEMELVSGMEKLEENLKH